MTYPIDEAIRVLPYVRDGNGCGIFPLLHFIAEQPDVWSVGGQGWRTLRTVLGAQNRLLEARVDQGF